MKPTLLLALAIFLFTPSFAQVSTAGLVAQWHFSGNSADSSGNGHNGTIHGSVVADTGKHGVAGTAMHFSSGGYITVPNSSDFNVTKVSICAIVKPTAFFTGTCQGNAIIVRGPGPSRPGHWGISLGDNAYNDCNTADTNKYLYTPIMGDDTASQLLRQYSPSTHTGSWYCVVVTYDSAICRLYVNGSLKLSYPESQIGVSNDSIGIGRDVYASPHTFPFTGLIDEIWVYDRVLDSADIDNFCANAGKPTSVQNVNNGVLNGVNIYPNPTENGQFTIVTDKRLENDVKYVKLYSLVGQEIIEESFTSTEHIVNTNKLAKGTYFIKVCSGNECITKQLVVQ